MMRRYGKINLLFRPFKIGRNLVCGYIEVFLVFHANSVAINNHRNGSSHISH